MFISRLRFHRFNLLGLIVSAMLLLVLSGASAAPLQSGGVNGADFATQELGFAWDMNSPTEIAFEYTRDNGNVSGLTFSGGELQATATNNDPRITLLVPSHPSTNPV